MATLVSVPVQGETVWANVIVNDDAGSPATANDADVPGWDQSGQVKEKRSQPKDAHPDQACWGPQILSMSQKKASMAHDPVRRDRQLTSSYRQSPMDGSRWIHPLVILFKGKAGSNCCATSHNQESPLAQADINDPEGIHSSGT